MILRVIICFLILCSAACAEEVTYYFDTTAEHDYTPPTDEIYSVDGSTASFAYFNSAAKTAMEGTTCPEHGGFFDNASNYVISRVDIRAYCNGDALLYDVYMYDEDTGVGGTLVCPDSGTPGWNLDGWKNITNAKANWEWSEIDDIYAIFYNSGGVGDETELSKVEVRMTYLPIQPNIRGVNIN